MRPSLITPAWALPAQQPPPRYVEAGPIPGPIRPGVGFAMDLPRELQMMHGDAFSRAQRKAPLLPVSHMSAVPAPLPGLPHAKAEVAPAGLLPTRKRPRLAEDLPSLSPAPPVGLLPGAPAAKRAREGLAARDSPGAGDGRGSGLRQALESLSQKMPSAASCLGSGAGPKGSEAAKKKGAKGEGAGEGSGGSGTQHFGGKKGKFSANITDYLTSWFLRHTEHPYPESPELQVMSLVTNLGPDQVNRWFTNIRKRHWTPIVKRNQRPKNYLQFMIKHGHAPPPGMCIRINGRMDEMIRSNADAVTPMAAPVYTPLAILKDVGLDSDPLYDEDGKRKHTWARRLEDAHNAAYGEGRAAAEGEQSPSERRREVLRALETGAAKKIQTENGAKVKAADPPEEDAGDADLLGAPSAEAIRELRLSMPSSSLGSGNNRRFLPKAAVEYLKNWFCSPAHVNHPYPTEAEKEKMAADTGLSTHQVDRWLMNNRKRAWRPWVARQAAIAKRNAAEKEGTPEHPTRRLEEREQLAASVLLSMLAPQGD